MHLRLEGIRKTFGEFVALDAVDLAVGEHEFVCLLGPSGCGKTTLLRIIAGLLEADSGRMMLGERDLSRLPARARGFGIVFQSYSLFPNMTVARNIRYGLKLRGEARSVIDRRVSELLDLTRLAPLAGRYPWQLSGVQQQRVALAQARAVDPALILLDEPLSALNAPVRVAMRAEIHEVQQRLAIPTIMVTHDQEEALTLADKIVCMNEGRIVQVGTPQDLYLRPRTRFVADFVGVSNRLPTEFVRSEMPALMAGRPQGADGDYIACIRPENLTVTADPAGDGRVLGTTFLGNLSQFRVQWRGREVVTECHRASNLRPGDAVRVAPADAACAWVLA